MWHAKVFEDTTSEDSDSENEEVKALKKKRPHHPALKESDEAKQCQKALLKRKGKGWKATLNNSTVTKSQATPQARSLDIARLQLLKLQSSHIYNSSVQ